MCTIGWNGLPSVTLVTISYYEFSWGVGEIVTATLDAGLQLTTLREYPYTNGFRRFTDMRELSGNRFTMPEGMPNFPLMMGLVAQKPETL